MYRFRGGLGDLCSTLINTYNGDFLTCAQTDPQFPQCQQTNDLTYQYYQAAAQNLGCAVAPAGAFSNYHPNLQAAASVQTVTPASAATAYLQTNPSARPSDVVYQLIITPNLTTHDNSMLNAAVSQVMTNMLAGMVSSSLNINVVANQVAIGWSTQNLSQMAAALNAQANPVIQSTPNAPYLPPVIQPTPVATPVAAPAPVSVPDSSTVTIQPVDLPSPINTVVDSSGNVSSPSPVVIVSSSPSSQPIPVNVPVVAPVTSGSGSSSPASSSTVQNTATQIAASNPTASVNDVASAVQSSTGASTAQATQAAQQAVTQVVQSQVPAASPTQVQQAVAASPTAPASSIAQGVALSTGTTPATGAPSASTTATGTTTTPTAASAAGAAVPAGTWCFPGDTSAPFSSAIPVCSTTLLGAVGVLALLFLMGGRR